MHPNLPKLPCGITSFQDLRENNYLYVDKTDLIYDLVTKKRFCLLTRPRRFGKSLLLSTLDCLFRKQMQLFQGLKISPLWQEEPCKTINLDLSGIDFKSVDEFRAALADQIAFSADKNHLDAGSFSETNPVINLDRFVRQASPAKVVILVDEYDAPVRNLQDRELLNDMIEYLRTFFTAIKRVSRYCRFILLTGITRNNFTDEYSCLNFLTDISLQADFAALLGYTETDLNTYFTPYIRDMQKLYPWTETEIREKLRRCYDGYSFDRLGKIRVYNNWSVLGFFEDDIYSFSNYWYESGIPSKELRSFLIELSLTPDGPIFSELLKHFKEGFNVPASALNMAPHVEDHPAALLFFTGYLTIADTFDINNPQQIKLVLPNYEIESSLARLFSECVYTEYSRKSCSLLDNWDVIVHNYADLTLLASLLDTIFNTYSYDSNIYSREVLLRDALFVICKLEMFATAREVINARGRSDLEIETPKERLIFEFKVARTLNSADTLLDEAAEQIKDRAYGNSLPVKPIVSYAVVISAVEKRVVRIRVMQPDGAVLGEWSADAAPQPERTQTGM